MEHQHLPPLIAEIAGWAGRNWQWISGVFLTAGLAIRWAWTRLMQGDYMSRTEIINRLEETKQTMVGKLADHERREFERYEVYQKDNKEEHHEIKQQLTRLGDIIIENMRKK